MPPADTAGDGEAAEPPVSPETAMRMASHYLARTSASTVRLREVLARKIRRRCESRDLSLPAEADLRTLIDGVVDRLAQAGLIDDAAYGRGRANVLARKGWPAWRIKAELERHGIDPETGGMADAVALDETAQARRLAERLRLGPFGTDPRKADRHKDIAKLTRAGFSVSVARAVVDGRA